MPIILLQLLKTAGVAFFTKLLGASITEKVFAELFFSLADYLAKQSSNNLDDEMVQKIKKAYNGES